jgi:hypothetical protein
MAITVWIPSSADSDDSLGGPLRREQWRKYINDGFRQRDWKMVGGRRRS